MPFGPSSNIDLAEILFTLFWVFFVALIFYLRREDKREGYPLESDRYGVPVQGFPATPKPKVFQLAHGGTQTAPSKEEAAGPIAARPAAPYPGAPLIPTGDPLVDGVGPASYANRSDTPDLTFYGENRVVPMRTLSDWAVDQRDDELRGMNVITADREVVGKVVDLWVDRAEPQIYYIEVDSGEAEGSTRTLVPFAFADIRRHHRAVEISAVYAHQFANAPKLKSPDEVTLLEEDQICAYFAGGTLFADSKRQEPKL